MPRSGTTLVEQIISSHSEIAGAGELPYLSRFGAAIATGQIPISNSVLTKFKKVMPIEYKKVLQENLEKDQNENKLAKLG